MQGAPGSRSDSGLSAAHDHHLRMLDMAAYINQGPNADTGLILDQYGNSFSATAAAALYSPQFAAAAGLTNGQRMNHDRHPHAGFMNGIIKLETFEGAGTREQSAVTNVTSASGEVSGYSSSAGERETANKGNDDEGPGSQHSGGISVNGNGLTVKVKAKRKLPGMPDPDAEVVALSPRTLQATNRFICEICNKGFQRDQNLQLHRRGHNLPWKLKQRGSKEVRKKVYVCPEASCVHHDPARALGDLTGIKKHFSRKHGEKKWKCDKCSKRYAVQSDWKAHSKTCGTREYRCDCGTLFSRRDSFTTHRAFCDALAEESALRVQSQINGEGGHGHLPSAVAAQLLQAGGGGANPAPTSKLGGSGCLFLDHMPPFDHSSATSTGRAATRLPLWLSAAAAAGDHHNFLSAAANPTNIPLHPPPLSSLQANPPPANLFFSGPPMPSSASLLAASSGMLFANAVSDSPLLSAEAAANGSYGFLSSLTGLASLSNAANNSALYAAQPGGPSSPQISATSLLQKAAQMGSVNACNGLSLFEGSLASSMMPVSSTDAMCWPSPSSMRSSHGLSSIDMNHALSRGQLAPNIGGFHGDKSNPMIDPESRLRSSFLQSMDNISAVQEMVASFNSGGASVGQIGGPGSAASLFTRSSEYGDNGAARPKGGSQILGPDLGHPMISASESCRSMIQPQQNPQQELGSLAPVLNRLSSSKLMKMEDASAAADNFTRDFLGVRGDNVMLESLEKSVSQQRDMAVTYYSNSYNNSKDNLSSEGENMSSQSYPKPWDGFP